ncbi:MAG TPA: hypothetical protein VFJ94_10745 [Intrasporangium sp.]|uniref:phage major capsid protein n=1 Tax=Intrasporangium sp. TaxID=1925024 RepID=UPI002D7A0AD0|nr:hypothetical protein [Intrasporangium sp.]HET7398988.1 hypothetical protein [Intrasporangium sp.]
MTIIQLAESFGVTESGIMAGTGPQARRRGANHRSIAEAATLLGAAWGGSRYAALAVHEALSTSDLFKSAAGDVLDREMLAQYEAMPTQWTGFATRTTVANFRKKYLRELSGARSALERVPELSEYPSADYAVSERSIQVGKFGRRFGYSFEAQVNDDLEELRQVPAEFATAAGLTEDREALKLLATSTGAPNTGFFNATNGNIGTGVITQDRLQAAITTVSTKRDAQGNLLSPGPLQLVVGPALQFTAQRILDQQVVRVTNGSVTTEEPNPLRGRITLRVLENLPGTAWFVLPLPSAPRPAFYVAFLRGWETPDMRYKNDQGARVGGGAIAPEEGDFDVDAVYWRVRHIVGAATGDPMFTYASDGIGA